MMSYSDWYVFKVLNQRFWVSSSGIYINLYHSIDSTSRRYNYPRPLKPPISQKERLPWHNIS